MVLVGHQMLLVVALGLATQDAFAFRTPTAGKEKSMVQDCEDISGQYDVRTREGEEDESRSIYQDDGCSFTTSRTGSNMWLIERTSVTPKGNRTADGAGLLRITDGTTFKITWQLSGAIWTQEAINYIERPLVLDEGHPVGDAIQFISLQACKRKCTLNSRCNSFSFKASTQFSVCYLKDRQISIGDNNKGGRATGFKSYFPEVGNPETCLDLNKNCNIWAETGLCDINPDFMSGKCPLACGNCVVEACIDLDDYCNEWAQDGECDTSPGWMNANCPLSCGVC